MRSAAATQFRGSTTQLRNKIPIAERLRPEFYEQELRKIFRRAWLPALSTSDLPERQSYAVVEMPTFKTSLLIVRGSDGRVRAFHNMCRHRGNKLVRTGSGCTSGHTCGFHGWRYSSEGDLVNVTDEAQFRDLDPAALGLISVHAEEWDGFIFVNFDTKPRETLAEWLADFYGGYAGYFADREKIASYSVVVECNWNLTVNSFTEGYHSLFVHRNTVPDYQGGKGNPMRHRPYLEVMKRHSKYSAHANPDHRPTPAEALIYRLGVPLFPTFPRFDPTTFPPGVNPSRYDQWAFDLSELFPNFVMLTGGQWHINMWFWPIDASHTEIRVEAHAVKARKASDRLSHSYFKVRNREVTREDLNTMEAVQKMLASGAMSDMFLSQQEMLLQNHFKAADEMLAEA